MGNEVSIPPINGIVKPSISVAINEIISELNSIFTNNTSSPQYLLSFATDLQNRLGNLSNSIDDLQANAPSPQNQLTSLQGAIDGITSTLSSYIASNNNTVSNISQSLITITSNLNNVNNSLGSVNIVDLSTTLTNLIATVNNQITALSNKVDKTTTVNGRALIGNIAITPSDIGLNNVNNTTDLNKPISTDTQTALNQKISVGVPITAGSVGSSNAVPVISYNTNGLITSAGTTSIAITPTQAGLSNVQNVNTTQASNVTLDQPITSQSTNINQGDNVMIALTKLQNQQGNKVPKVSGTVTNLIPVFDSTGGLQSSSMRFNDLGTSSIDVLSASSVINKINSAIVGVVNLRGSYSVASTSYPTTNGSGSGGIILKGDLWYASDSGTLGGNLVSNGYSILALVDAPGQINSNWSIIPSGVNYTPEDQANKTNTTMSTSSVAYPTVGLVKSYVDTGLSAKENTVSTGLSTQYYKGDKSWATLDKAAVGLGSVTNDSQLKRAANDFNSFTVKTTPSLQDVVLLEDSQNAYNKVKTTLDSLPITTAVTAAISGLVPNTTTVNAKALNGNITLTPTDIGLGNVDNTTDLSKPLSINTINALSNKVDKINLPAPVTVGNTTTIPVITYNTQGQVTSSSGVAISVTKANVGLGNVQNVDTTSLANSTIQGTFTPLNASVVTGDTGAVAISKLQGQISDRASLLNPPVLGRILVSDANGDISNSNKSFNDTTTTLSNVLSASEVQSRINAALTSGGLQYIGVFTPVVGATYPLTTAIAGNIWIVGSVGTIGSVSVHVGDLVLALVDNPGNTASNWSILQGCLGFTAENQANRETTLSTTSNTKYPTSKAVADYVTSVGSGSLPSGGTTAQYLRGDTTWQTLNSTAVGLGSVTNGAQVLRASDFSTFPPVASLASGDTFIFEDASNSSAKSYITYANLVSNLSSSILPTLTASRALESNVSGQISVSSVTNTELGYMSGVTSGVQSQLDSKLNNTVAVLTAVTTPATPVSGSTKVYTKSDGTVYKLSSDGVETSLGPGAGINITGTTGGLLTRSSGGQPQNSSVQISTDNTFTGASDSFVPTQKAVSDYIASQVVTSGKHSVSAASTANIAVTGSGTLTTTANGALTVDGYALLLNDSVLLNGQSTASQNGIYTVTTLGTVSTPTILTRRLDSNTEAEMVIGSVVSVVSGTTFAGTLFYQSTVVNTLETDTVSYVMINVGIGNLRTTNNLSELTASSSTARSNISAAKSGVNTDISAVTLDNNGLNIKCNTGIYKLTVVNTNSLTTDRFLNVGMTDADTTLTFTSTSASISGVNTGDETSSSIITKVGNASASNTGVLTSTDWSTFNAKESTSNKGVASGYASLDGTGKVPSSQLPTLSTDLASLSDVLFT